jgi:hypothetical protein
MRRRSGFKADPWRKIDPQLVLVSCLATRRERAAAIEKIAARSGRSVSRLCWRGRYIGLKYLDNEQGTLAAENWLRHTRVLVRTYGNSVALYHAMMRRYDSALAAHKAFLRASYTVSQAAGLLQVSRNAIVFWADVLEALHRDVKGRFTGAELKRFWMEDKYLLAAVRAAEYRKATKRK